MAGLENWIYCQSYEEGCYMYNDVGIMAKWWQNNRKKSHVHARGYIINLGCYEHLLGIYKYKSAVKEVNRLNNGQKSS